MLAPALLDSRHAQHAPPPNPPIDTTQGLKETHLTIQDRSVNGRFCQSACQIRSTALHWFDIQFVIHAVKVNEAYYHEAFLSQQLLRAGPVRQVYGEFIFH